MNTRIVSHWNEYFYKLPDCKQDIYFTEEYVRLYESDIAEACCILCEETDAFLFMPFLRHRIKQFYDFEIAYG